MSEVQQVTIDSLETHPQNIREGNVPAIAASLQRFGQVKPIIVQASTRYIVAGNHTYLAAKELGWASIAAIVLDIDDDTAASYLIADNRTSDLAKYRSAEALYDLVGSVTDLEGTGFTVDDLDDLENEIGANVTADAPEEATRYEGHIERSIAATATVEEREPMRDVLLLMPQSAARTFGQQIAALQRVYGTRTLADTVRAVVNERFEALEQERAGAVEAPAAVQAATF